MERYLVRAEREFVWRLLRDKTQPFCLLDACCGDGSISAQLYDMGLSVVGLDMNPVPLTLFRVQTHGVIVVQGDALNLPFADGSVDCILAIQCLHFVDRSKFLQECGRVLCTGGLLIFESLNRSSYKWLLKRLSRCCGTGPVDKWLNVPTCAEIVRAVSESGFELQEISGYGWVPFTRHSDGMLVDALATVEQVLHLDRLYSISPRILVAARRGS